MQEYTVEQLAKRSGLTILEITRLLEERAGVKVNEKDVISPEIQNLILSSIEKKSTRGKLSLKKKAGSSSGVTVTIKKKTRVVSRAVKEQKEASPVIETQQQSQDVSSEKVTEDRVGSLKEPKETTVKKQQQEAQGGISEVKESEVRGADKTNKSKSTLKPVKESSIIEEKRKKKKGHFYDDEEGKDRHKEIPLKVVSGKHGAKKPVLKDHRFEKPTKPVLQEVVIPEVISVADLAQKAAVKVNELITVLMKEGMMVKKNQIIDQDTAALVIEMIGHKPILQKTKDIEEGLASEDDVRYEGEKIPRAPVVTFMGHVDHGKTTLLDYIRATRVTAGEAGGITQHIGAYTVTTDTGGKITFLDTPGHAAFTEMRARGVQCTDIVVLVVAADDGVMPQTLEAIEHAKAGNVPIVVAINKMDKPEADADRIRTELSNRGVVCETWSGDTIFQPVSAKDGTGVSDLLESILLQAEILELKAYAEGMAKGVVIESCLDKGRGPVATVLVQSGKLKQGDVLLAGKEFGRVRAMVDGVGKVVGEAGPSEPVEVLGLSGVPEAGDPTVVVESERRAREVSLYRKGSHREKRLASSKIPTFSDVLTKAKLGELKEVNLILKADTHGSVEAAAQALRGLSNEEVKVCIVSAQVGGITESDVNLAIASRAMILGFNVRADAAVRKLKDKENVEISYYSVIYDMIDTIKSLVKGMVGPKFEERVIGQLSVKDVFRSSKFGLVAGCLVTEGVVRKDARLRLLRDSIVLHEGEVTSLRHYRDEVKEVKSGSECGLGLSDFNDIRQGDQFEIFVKEQVLVKD